MKLIQHTSVSLDVADHRQNLTNTEFHTNTFSRSRAVRYGRTDMARLIVAYLLLPFGNSPESATMSLYFTMAVGMWSPLISAGTPHCLSSRSLSFAQSLQSNT